MIPVKPLPAQIPNWQQLWRDSLRDPLELLEMLGLAGFSDRISVKSGAAFAFRVPRGFAAKMRHGDIHDPLLRQVLPLSEEETLTPGYGFDAVGDLASRGTTGVLHKYRGRALLVATGSCAINCRYCFRRHFPYAEETAAAGQWQDAIGYLRNDASIHEVILSGGDPLSLTTPKLAQLTDALKTLPQIKRLRLHTRLPVVLPERVDAGLLEWLSGLPWPVTVVIHANHGNELGTDVAQALRHLKQAGTTLLNQSVLLAGVNDDILTLQSLSEALHAHGVLPYYLHQLDRVQGAAHFSVPDARAIALHRELVSALPGYLVPKLVRETAGEPNKSPLY